MESEIPTIKKGISMNNVGSVCSKQRHLNKPKKANLTKTPLKKIEKFVDASTWALGNQP